jgi:fumagillin biosynthesis transferase
MQLQEDVEFKTIDGVTLRGRVYPANERGAGIVLSPGVSPPC